MKPPNSEMTAQAEQHEPRPYGQWAIDAWLLGLLLLVFGRVHSVYPQLPEKLPMNFNLAGEPNGWAQTNVWSAYGMPAFGLLLGVVMAVLIWLIGRVRDPRRFINIPGKDRLTPAGVEALRVVTMRLLGLVKVVTVTMLGHMHWIVIDVALGQRDGMGYVPAVYGVLLVISTVYMLIRMYMTIKNESQIPKGAQR